MRGKSFFLGHTALFCQTLGQEDFPEKTSTYGVLNWCKNSEKGNKPFSV